MKSFCPIFIVIYYVIRALLLLPNSNYSYISFLNVGQGDAIVINIPQYGQILIDTGFDYQSNYLSARQYIFPVCSINYIFITHYDSDHSGGLERITRYCPNAKLYDNLSYGDVIRLGSTQLYILNPREGGFRREENDDSLILLVKKDGFESLLTGDAGLEILTPLISEVGGLQKSGLVTGNLEVYKVSHHGSIHNSSFEIFDLLKPRYCVVSVGKNTYGHPAPSVLKDIKDTGCKLYRTDIDGTIMIYF